MANYFVLNSKFKPYSFDELIKPYQMYGQAYQEQEALIDAAKEKEFSPTYLNKEQDAEAYALYDEATRGLQAVSDELATKGLSSALRGRLRTTAKDYKSTMDALTISQAQLMQERDRRSKLGHDYVFQQEDLRIGDYLGGKTPNQGGEKLSDITKGISEEFSRRAQGITSETWNKLFAENGVLISGYYDVTTKIGLTDAQLDTILADDATWNQMLSNPTITNEQKQQLQGFRDVIQAKQNSISMESYDPINQAKIREAIVIGAHSGLGTTRHGVQADKNFESPELRYRRERDKVEDQRYKEEKENVNKIKAGQLPFHTTTDGDQWFSDGKIVWAVDKDGEVVQDPMPVSQLGKDTTTTSGKKISDATRKQFPMYFEAMSEGKKRTFKPSKSREFNVNDQEEISFSRLSPKQQAVLKDKLEPLNLTEQDIKIYRDYDALSRNHYKVVLPAEGGEVVEITLPEIVPGSPQLEPSDPISSRNIPAGRFGGF